MCAHDAPLLVGTHQLVCICIRVRMTHPSSSVRIRAYTHKGMHTHTHTNVHAHVAPLLVGAHQVARAEPAVPPPENVPHKLPTGRRAVGVPVEYIPLHPLTPP